MLLDCLLISLLFLLVVVATVILIKLKLKFLNIKRADTFLHENL